MIPCDCHDLFSVKFANKSLDNKMVHFLSLNLYGLDSMCWNVLNILIKHKSHFFKSKARSFKQATQVLFDMNDEVQYSAAGPISQR